MESLNFPAQLYRCNGTVSKEQLTKRVCALSQQLRRVQPKAKLAVCSNSPEQLLLIAIACLHSGWQFQPITPRWPKEKRTELSQQVKSDYVWPAAEFSSDITVAPIELDFTASSQPTTLQPATLQSGMKALCSTLFTSGSTGQPKAVSHTLEQHLVAARYCNPILNLQSSSCWLLSLPIWHAAGYGILIRSLLAQSSIALPTKVGVTLADLKRWPVTHLSLVATQLHRLLQEREFNSKDLTLKEIMLGGGPVPETLIQQAQARGFRLTYSYGMTETAAAIVLGELQQDSGIPLTGAEPFKLQHGELMLDSQQVALQYQSLNQSKPLRDEKGLFATGDLAEIKENKLYINGRKDNRFISGGENIQPELIEQSLQQHPTITMALVVPTADSEFGQRPVAFIQWQEEPVPKEALNGWLRERLPGFMCPIRYLEWPSSLDKNQKPVRSEFIRLAEESYSPS